MSCIQTCKSENMIASRFDCLSKYGEPMTPIHERLYEQKSRHTSQTPIRNLPSNERPFLLAITGENRTLASMQRIREQKLLDKKVFEQKQKEATEFISKIKKQKDKMSEARENKIKLKQLRQLKEVQDMLKQREVIEQIKEKEKEHKRNNIIRKLNLSFCRENR